MRRIGWSAGLTLRKVGGVGMSLGSCRNTREIATCTSCAAASMSRLRVNCRMICVVPMLLEEVIESTPEMVENSRSSGVATAVAMVVGFAPGSCPVTWMVG